MFLIIAIDTGFFLFGIMELCCHFCKKLAVYVHDVTP